MSLSAEDLKIDETPMADSDSTASAPTDEQASQDTAPALRGGALLREIGFWKIVREDLRTHDNAFLSAGFSALFWYRLGSFADTITFKPIRWPLMAMYLIGQHCVQNFYGVELKRTSQVGRRLRLAHQHGIVIHHLADIGDDVLIRHNVTFGIGNKWTWSGPKIGDRVTFSPGVVVIGDVVIGDDVKIGPNCTVSTDVPAGRNLFMPSPRSLPQKPAGEDNSD